MNFVSRYIVSYYIYYLEPNVTIEMYLAWKKMSASKPQIMTRLHLNSCAWLSPRTLNTAIKQERDLKQNLDNTGIHPRQGIITIVLGRV